MNKTRVKEKYDIKEIISFSGKLLNYCEKTGISPQIAMLSCILYSEFLKDYLNVSQKEYDENKRILSQIVKNGFNKKNKGR